MLLLLFSTTVLSIKNADDSYGTKCKENIIEKAAIDVAMSYDIPIYYLENV